MTKEEAKGPSDGENKRIRPVGVIILIAAILVGAAVGVAVGLGIRSRLIGDAVTFEKENFSITLPAGCREKTPEEGELARFEKKDVTVTVERFERGAAYRSPAMCADEYFARIGREESAELFEEESMTVFEYRDDDRTGAECVFGRVMIDDGFYYVITYRFDRERYAEMREEAVASAHSAEIQ